MVIPGREQLRAAALRYLEAPGARFLHAIGLTPNQITLLGFSLSLVAAALAGAGYLLAGGVLFLAASAMDLMDGAMARLTLRTTSFGALLDSVADRLGEAALFLALAIYGLRADMGEGRQLFFVVALFLALVTSQTVSYIRARGEGLGISTRTGLMTRPERVVLLSLGLILGQRPLEVVLILVSCVSAYTLLQRLFHIRRALGQLPGAVQGVDKRPDTL